MTDLFEAVKQEVDNRLRIKKVTLENYRNITYKEVLLDGESVIFKGQNELGKTNLIESIFYAVSGKLFNGITKNEKIGIKPVDSDNDTKTSIKIEFLKNNFTLEKVVFENWTKKTNEFKGTETVYYVNGAVVKTNSQAITLLTQYLGLDILENQFKGTELENIDLFALMYNTNYIKTIDYKLVRALIIDMVGEVKPQDIINSKPIEYSSLVEPLVKHNMELQTLKSATRTEIFGDKNKKGLSDRIKEQEAIKEDYETKANKELDLEEIERAKVELKKLNLDRDELKLKLSQTSSQIDSDYELKISKKELEYRTERERLFNEHLSKNTVVKDEKLEKEIADRQTSEGIKIGNVRELNEKVSTKRNEISTLENTVKNKGLYLDELNKKRARLIEQWNEIKGDNKSETLTCPHCNKPFHLHETKEHQKILETKLGNIKEHGVAVKDEIVALENGIKELKQNLQDENDKLLELTQQRDKSQSELEIIQKDILDLINKKRKQENNQPHSVFNELEHEVLVNIKKDIETLRQTKLQAYNNVVGEKTKYQMAIDTYNVEIYRLEQIISQEEIKKNDMKRVQEKKEELAKLYDEETILRERLQLIARLEKDIYQTLDQKVANIFGENFTFQLYKQNIDGSYDTRMCEIFAKNRQGKMINLNTINTGTYHKRAIEFISIIKKHYGIEKSFVFVDELSSLDSKNRHELLAFGEQVLATMMSENQSIEMEVIK